MIREDNKQQNADFEKAEIDLLKEGLKRTYKERFLMATRLYKIQKNDAESCHNS